nr:MAG TPA: hypothetical protein [Caudoviricetes sp.]
MNSQPQYINNRKYYITHLKERQDYETHQQQT